jgi:hypothetical protein
MTIEEAVKAGLLKLQVHRKHMHWDGEQWVVYKKFRGVITPISKTSSVEVALEDLLK